MENMPISVLIATKVVSTTPSTAPRLVHGCKEWLIVWSMMLGNSVDGPNYGGQFHGVQRMEGMTIRH